MKDKYKDKTSSSGKHHKNKKKQKKKHKSSSDSDVSGEEMQWVEAPSFHKKNSQKKKKRHKKYESSSSSDSDLSEKEMASKRASSSSILKKEKGHSKKGKDSSSSDSESSEEENTQKISTPNIDAGKRDSWMNEESFVHTLSKEELYSTSRQRRTDSMKEKRDKEEKIQRERELNPHWKNEGTGLPEKETNVDSLSLPSTSVGDGGYSWLKKAYYRIQEQAQQEGRSMEEIAVERWGSLSKLTSLIEEAEERMKSHPDWKHSKNQFRDKYDRSNRSSTMQFKKPSHSYESEKSFDSPFQFRRPTNDPKSHKVVNQFKSSRKTNDMCYAKERTEYENSRGSLQHTTNSNKEDFEIKINSSSNRCPAWKKPQKFNTGNTEISGSDNQITESSSKEIVKEIDCMPVIYSENDLNKLAAQQIKAEIMGNTSLSEKLKKQLDEARELVKEKGFAKQPSKIVEEVILSKFDSQGQSRPIQTTQEKISDYKQKRSNKHYDDSNFSLKQMFEREKLTTVDDHMEMFVEATAGSNETAEIDYESGHISKKLCKKLSSTREEEKDIGKAMKQHQKLTASLESCKYCLDQPQMKKYLIVHIGENVYLSLPNFQTLAEGHCLIVPKNHVSSFLFLDENEWREVNDFKNQLRNMYRSDHKSVIFLETSMNFRHFPHAVLECIPVPEEEGDMAPFYFKKAIQESEYEWAHNKKLIDLTNKGLRRSVPKNLPYFYVEFDPKVHEGFAHVIEEEKYFPRNFGKEVVGGMLDINYNYLYKNKKEDPLKKTEEVVNFTKKWKNAVI